MEIYFPTKGKHLRERVWLFGGVLLLMVVQIKGISSMPFVGVSAFQPLFDDEEATVTTDLFVPLNLSCKARAEPLPIYEWSRDTSMRDDQTKSFQLSQNTTTHNGRTLLMIRNVTWSHRGVYFCNAWNSEGYNFKKYNLVVNRKYLNSVISTDNHKLRVGILFK